MKERETERTTEREMERKVERETETARNIWIEREILRHMEKHGHRKCITIPAASNMIRESVLQLFL